VVVSFTGLRILECDVDLYFGSFTRLLKRGNIVDDFLLVDRGASVLKLIIEIKVIISRIFL